MKKKLLIGIPLFLVLLTFVFLLSGRLTGSALESSVSFQTDGNKLVRYTGNEERVVIPENITSIEQGAFEGNETMKYVVFPSGLKEIGYHAFYDCKYLKKVILPDEMETIGDSAFAACTSLEEAYFGRGMNKIGDGVFSGCSLLEEVEIHEKNADFVCMDGVLYNKDQSVLYEVLGGRDKAFLIMPETVTEIKPYAFYGCKNLMDVALSKNMEKIGPYAFCNADGLRSLSTAFGLKEIDDKAFADCKSLEQVYLPDSVMKIAENAFDGCDKLDIYTVEGSFADKYCSDNERDVIYSPKIELDVAYTKKKEYQDKKNEERSSEIAENQTSQKPAVALPNLSELFAGDKDVIGKTYIVGNHAMVLIDPSIEVTRGENVRFNDLLDKITDGVIPEKLFYKEKTLDQIVLPETIKEIGKMSFARSGLNRIEIPEGVETIGYGAFYHCDNLKDVTIPSTVTFVGDKAFEHTKWYEDWLANGESDYLIVGDGVLIGYKGDKKAYQQPADVKTVCCDLP